MACSSVTVSTVIVDSFGHPCEAQLTWLILTNRQVGLVAPVTIQSSMRRLNHLWTLIDHPRAMPAACYYGAEGTPIITAGDPITSLLGMSHHCCYLAKVSPNGSLTCHQERAASSARPPYLSQQT